MTKALLDADEAASLAPKQSRLRPRDAATLILLRRERSGHKVLMGKRREDLAFMPGKFVFPGGRRDRADGRIPVAAPLPEADMARLATGLGARSSATRVRAIAMAAVREMFEEAGLMLGLSGALQTRDRDWMPFAMHGVVPDLSRLRYIARAVTPPGRVRRFDTHFFTAFEESVAKSLPHGITGELTELRWFGFAEARALDIPVITRVILGELEERLANDPELTDGNIAVPHHHMRGTRFVRDLT